MARRNASSTHVIVLPGGGYSQHVAHEAEPIVGWLAGLGRASRRVSLPAAGAPPGAAAGAPGRRFTGSETAAPSGSG